jgi:hypothetical protein
LPFSNSSSPVLRLHLDTLVVTQDKEHIRMRATGVEIGIPAVLDVISGDRNASVVKFGDFQVRLPSSSNIYRGWSKTQMNQREG